MRGALTALLVSRAIVEGLAVACLAATLHAVFGARPPLPIGDAVLVSCGGALMLVALLREQRSDRGSRILTATVIGGAALLGVLAAPARADGIERLGRLVGFGILGEILLWRTLTISRGLSSWQQARGAVSLAALAVVLASVVPGVDAGALPPFVLLGIAAAGVALSLSRSAEELELAGTRARGGPSARSAASAALALGALALAAAAFAPSLRALAAAATEAVAPVLGTIAYWLVLPFAYLAAALVYLLEPLFRRIAEIMFSRPLVQTPPVDVEEERRMLEAVQATRPIVVGAVEIVVMVAALIVAVIIVERMTRERRSHLPAGATIEREAAAGFGLGPLLGALRPRRGGRRRAPRDDGTASSKVRVLYWRFLEAAERAGAGWRATAETPTEHHARISAADARWAGAEPIVRAFERVRYAEEEPAPAAVARARAALEGLASR
ncbi:MAG TPA: DUF4129 domain-containing protein [Candidatus Limnocylindria bacterium]|nr:DUF4129 domain-containing protein [Candidatus Limnocylindria bacterium]